MIFVLLSLLSTQDGFLRPAFLNLATELLGVVVVFFLVNRLFQIEEMDINERVGRLLEKLELESTVEADDFFHKAHDLGEYISKSKVVKIVGVTLTVCMEKNCGEFKQAIRQGASIRVVLIDGKEESLRASARRSETDSISYFKKRHAATLENINYLLKFANSLEEDLKGSFEVKTLTFPSTSGIEVFVNEEIDFGRIKVEIYPQFQGWENPPIFTVDKYSDANWFEHFDGQFEAIWERALPYNPEV